MSLQDTEAGQPLAPRARRPGRSCSARCHRRRGSHSGAVDGHDGHPQSRRDRGPAARASGGRRGHRAGGLSGRRGREEPGGAAEVRSPFRWWPTSTSTTSSPCWRSSKGYRGFGSIPATSAALPRCARWPSRLRSTRCRSGWASTPGRSRKSLAEVRPRHARGHGRERQVRGGLLEDEGIRTSRSRSRPPMSRRRFAPTGWRRKLSTIRCTLGSPSRAHSSAAPSRARRGWASCSRRASATRLRVSLAADPVEEVKVGIQLLKGSGLRRGGLTFVACPTCGRCSVNMIPIAERVEKKLHVVRGTCTWR